MKKIAEILAAAALFTTAPAFQSCREGSDYHDSTGSWELPEEHNIKDDEQIVPRPFTTRGDVFNPNGSHIQGIAASEDALYASQDDYLVKMNWKGTLLASKAVVNHTGDLCWYGGELYSAVAISNGTPEGIGRIQVFDKNLKLVRECEIDRRTDGITVMDGVIYIGMGAKTQPSSDYHRVNILGRFDARTLKEIAPRADFDYGYLTSYGFQDITNDGKEIYASFYATSGAPQIAVFDKDLRVLRTYYKDANQGFDVMPRSLTDGKLVFVVSTTKTSSSPKAVDASIDFWTPDDKN